MLLTIRHFTSYSYDHPVALGPHCLRLTPRPDTYAAIKERQLNIFPLPGSIYTVVENDGSISHWARFMGETKTLTVESKMTVELLEGKNPFDYCIYPETCLTLPMVYPPEILRELKAFLNTDTVSPKIRGFASDILSQAGGKTVDFLIKLAQYMKREFIYEGRLLGAPHKPEDTLRTRRGSCRDWACLYIAAARAAGLAGRFVSGYYFDEKPLAAELHAWAEIYIPGGGWRGFDPTLGLACYEHHIALASSASAAAVAPIQGTFIGHAQSEMKLELEYQYSSMPVGS